MFEITGMNQSTDRFEHVMDDEFFYGRSHGFDDWENKEEGEEDESEERYEEEWENTIDWNRR